jgi:succinyl-diaminopimelate desuccinylase
MKELIELTKSLIRFPSVNSRPDQIHACADCIEDYLKSSRIAFQRFNFNNTPSILVLPENRFAPVVLMSHFDVVDGPEHLFSPWEENGCLFGRGSIDDKYAVALSLVLLKNHVERLGASGKGQRALPFGVLLTGDEEIGGADGAQKMLHEFKTDFCIALDGGNMQKIVVREKGILRLKLIARGKTAHGARPWLGENAIEHLIDDYQRLKAFFDVSAPDHWHRTLNFSIMHAGSVINQVPDYAEALFDIRYTEADDIDALVQAVQASIQGELQVVSTSPMFMGGKSPYIDRLLAFSPSTKLGCEHGASDARHLADHGIPGIVWGADGDMTQHAENEHIDIDSFIRLYHILDQFLSDIGNSLT